jgi:hypothetical protein
MARLVRLKNTRYLWISGAAASTLAAIYTAPTVASLTPGTGIVAIHANMTKDSDVAMDDSDSVTELGVDDDSKIEVPTIRSYHGMLKFFRDFDATTALPTATDCCTLIAENTLGWIVKREGIASATAVAAAQVVEVYEFRTDVWKFSVEDGLIKASIKLWQQGRFKSQAVVAA